MKKIVAIGGGTGLSTLLRGLRDYPLEISAIVTMTDDGASTGILRRELGILPPGDIRQCIAALSQDETMLVDLFKHRFRKGFGLKGHSVGNLLLSALREMTGSFESAVEVISRMLSIKGKVIPSTLQDIHLEAVFENGRKILGESKITKYGYSNKIKKINLNKKVLANPKAVEAIKNADIIIIGPGSLYTSLIPNFLIPQIQKAVEESGALKIFVSNISTERGETENFSLKDHLDILQEYKVSIDLVLANGKVFKKGQGDGYINPVDVDLQKGIILADLVNEGNYLYHDSAKLGREVWKVTDSITKHKKQKLYQNS